MKVPRRNRSEKAWIVPCALVSLFVVCCTCKETTAASSYPRSFSAVVMTVRRPNIQDWEELVCYYFQVGFDHFYVFFDEDGDPAIEATRAFGEKVTIIIRGKELEAQWTQGRLWEKLGAFISSEAMARQMLNEEVAVGLLREANVSALVGEAVEGRWLLHLDSDEVLHLRNMTARQHYSALTKDGFRQAVYLNHEAVPEKILKDGNSILESHTLFKTNHIAFSHLNSVEEARRDWEREKGPYALGYWTGKAAVRVDGDFVPFPLEVTRFFLPPGQAKRAIFDDPCILHYISPSPRSIMSKYKMIGKFPDNQFDPEAAVPVDGSRDPSKWPKSGRVLRHHLWLRDQAKQGMDRVVQVFRKHFLVEKESQEARRFMKTGLLKRIKTVRKLVKKAKKEGCPAKVPDREKLLEVEPEPPIELGPFTQCLSLTKSAEVFCFTQAPCCNAIRASKGALKVVDEPY